MRLIKLSMALLAALMLGLFCYLPGAALAAPAVEVGGLTLTFSFSGTSAGIKAAVAVTTKAGFNPDYVMVVDDYDATNPSLCIWFRGMANPSALLITGSTGVVTYLTSTGITVASGTITVGTGCQVNDGNYAGFAMRYAN